MSFFGAKGSVIKKSLACLLSFLLVLSLLVPTVVMADNGDAESITINLRATGLADDVFNVSDFAVPAGEVTQSGFTLDRHTAMGALVYYCQENGVDIDITSGDWGLFINQIGNNPDDEGNWMYYVDQSSPWVGADQYELDNGDSVHFVNHNLGFYALSLSIDKEEIVAGENITATVEYKDGDGEIVPASEASVYVSDDVDDFGNPVIPGTSVGQADADGKLTFTWGEGGTFYPYAEWNGKSTQYQWPVVFFSVPGIYSSSEIAVGDINPTVEVNIIGVEFDAGAADPGNWEIDTGTSGFTVNTISKDTDHKVTISFTGTAAAGTISIRAKAAALDGGADSNELSIPIVKNITVPQLDNDWVKNGNTVLDALLKYQQADGSFWWQEDTAGAVKGSTAQSLVALVDLAYGESTKHRTGQAPDYNPEHETLSDAVAKAVQWYRENHPSPGNWEGLPALWVAGEDLNGAPWQSTQGWRNTDPGFSTGATGNEHIHYIFRLLSVSLDPANIWDNRNLFAELGAQQQENGAFSDDNLGKHIWAIVALDVGRELAKNVGSWGTDANRQSAVNYLIVQQNQNGSFGSFSQLDHTGWALVALSNYQGNTTVDEAIEKAVIYLKGRQKDNAGFNPPVGAWGPEPENSNSNAAVISGLVAVGEKLLVEDMIVEVDDINIPVNVTVQEGAASAALKTTPVPVGGKQTAALPSVEADVITSEGVAKVSIPQGTVVSGPANWDGKIKLPELKEKSSVSVTDGNVSAVIEVGFPEGQLDFDKPVRLLIPGQAGKSVGYTRSGAAVTEITKTLSEDSQSAASAALSGDGGKIDVGDDLVIWTTHFTKFVAYTPTIVSPPPGNGGVAPSTITVSVQITGKHDTHFSGSVTLPTNRANALEALIETGVPFSARENNTYVYEIAGEREDLTTTAGWKYKVNGVVPAVPAKSYSISNGDQVMWFWAADADATDPGSGTVAPVTTPVVTPPVDEQLQKVSSDVRERVAVLLHERREVLPVEAALNQVEVIGVDDPMDDKAKEALKDQLNDNVVALAMTVNPEEDALISDNIGEILLQVDAGSLDAVTEITVEEISAESLPTAPTHVPVSPAYRLEPKGTAFSKPVLFSIRLAIPEDIEPAELVLAWLDEDDEQWYALPTVVDISNGHISAFLDHFTPFAVLAREIAPEPVDVEKPDNDAKVYFEDVTTDNFPWAYDAINYLAARDILRGVGDGRFEPSRDVTRAEFATMLVNALGLDAEKRAESSFTDVNKGAWYFDAVNAAMQAGIVKGATETTFQPHKNITRELMAVMLSRVKTPVANLTKGNVSFTDAKTIAPWAQYSVTQAVSRGLITGFPDGSFQPLGTTTRAQAAVVLYRLLIE